MLNRLILRNIALIENLEISFQNGLHVLSGETGAGKSIVVDAVNLVLGGRADRDIIRTGTDRAYVEAIFDVLGNHVVFSLLDQEEIDHDESTVTICREISQNGKNICRVGGVITSLSFLRELSPLLMDIHGQHEHQFLMNPEMHLQFLDRMGDETHQKLLKDTASSCERFLSIHREYAKLIRRNEEKNARLESLEKELQILHEARLKEGEEDQLTEEINRLRNAHAIQESLQAAHTMLAAAERDSSCLDKIKNACSMIKSLAKYGKDMETLAGRCESLYYELEELSYDLYQQYERQDVQPQELDKAENRLSLIRKIKKKYGENIPEILKAQRSLESEYSEMCSIDDRLRQTAAEHKRALAEYRTCAKAVTRSRKELAVQFENHMQIQLRDLGMESTLFKVVFSEVGADHKPLMPSLSGDDQVEFYISPNPGEPLKPLAKIASGGELSRLMLAIKTLEAGHRRVESMVFDEIDTGISGRAAQVVAEKMRMIAADCQVICVTHLPQIAAAADHQYLVNKKVQGQRTVTDVHQLDRKGRIAEIARMISGAEGISTDASSYAEKMLDAYA